MKLRHLTIVGLVLAATVAGCETTPKSEAAATDLNKDCDAAIALFKKTDPKMEDRFFRTAEGYAVIPRVGKGGLILGGAHGKGQVYDKNGTVIGYTTLSQGSIGAQIGGQVYHEIIFFQDENSMRSFTKGTFEFAAQATAVAAAAGASANANYENGVAVFTVGQKGLMAEASIGGQNFTFDDLETAQKSMAKD